MGIRSALVCGDTVSLYAGAGLVAGSVAQHELDETQVRTGGRVGARWQGGSRVSPTPTLTLDP